MLKRIIARTYYTAALLALAWLAISFIDVITNNHTPDPVYWNLNAFALLFGGV